MAKKAIAEVALVKVIQLKREGSGYGFVEYEIPAEALEEHGKITHTSEPDIYAIFVNQLTKRSRELFEI